VPSFHHLFPATTLYNEGGSTLSNQYFFVPYSFWSLLYIINSLKIKVFFLPILQKYTMDKGYHILEEEK
jgi:hypothetical protein